MLPRSSLLEWDAMDDYGDYDDYEPSCFEKFQDKFLYCFIPTLCLMFDASFITVGLICLVGADDDFDKCSGDGALTPSTYFQLWYHQAHMYAALCADRQLLMRRQCRKVIFRRTRLRERWRAHLACAKRRRCRLS